MPQCVGKMVQVSNLYLQMGASKILNKRLSEFDRKPNVLKDNSVKNVAKLSSETGILLISQCDLQSVGNFTRTIQLEFHDSFFFQTLSKLHHGQY